MFYKKEYISFHFISIHLLSARCVRSFQNKDLLEIILFIINNCRKTGYIRAWTQIVNVCIPTAWKVSVFIRIWTEYGEILPIPENTILFTKCPAHISIWPIHCCLTDLNMTWFQIVEIEYYFKYKHCTNNKVFHFCFRIFSASVTKSVRNYGFGHIY